MPKKVSPVYEFGVRAVKTGLPEKSLSLLSVPFTHVNFISSPPLTQTKGFVTSEIKKRYENVLQRS